MKIHHLTHHARIALLASAAILCAASAIAAPRPIQDLGPVEAHTPITATLWLAPADRAGFDAAAASRVTPGSANYHHWMSDSDIAAFAPQPAQITTLVQALKAAGLTVAPRGDAGDALRVTGPASTMQTAFATQLHMVRDGALTYRATTTDPHFSGPGGTLIAGITGLTDAPMRPYVLHQRDLLTGKPVEFPLPATVAPPTTFSTSCFKPNQTVSISHFVLHGDAQHATVNGPRLVATGFMPATTTCGFAPADIVKHYGLQAVYQAGYMGDGETIVIVDAYGSPNIEADANTFSSMTGLPPLTGSNFKIVYPDGQPTGNPYDTGWPVEVSLDVEWAHAMAPNAKIVLVVAPTAETGELVYALHYAVIHNLGNIISNSYGIPESDGFQEMSRSFNSVIELAAIKGFAVNVSTGDSGDNGLGTPLGAASIPADSVFATGVGGTSLNVPSDHGPVESAWGTTETYLGDINGVPVPPDFVGFTQGGGGGESVFQPKPAWQSALPGTGRQLPDVAAFADPFTGAIIVAPNQDGTASVVEVIGGTSVSSPVFSGIWALANQAAATYLGQAAPIIAAVAAKKPHALRDIVPITAVTNTLSGSVGVGSQSTFYGPAALLNLQNTQPTGFVGTSVQFTSDTVGINATFDIGFGADSSLMAAPGWDNATGFGVPNGLEFVKAIARLQ